jgi:hypothetical protein
LRYVLIMFIMINLHHVQITYCNYDCFHIFCKDLWNVNKYNTILLVVSTVLQN